MSDQPTRLPTWCADEPQPASNRAEPGGASAGYAYAEKPTHGGLNWLLWDQAEWTKHLHAQVLRASDLLDTTATVFRLTRSSLDYLVGGPLTQTPTSGGVYLWQGIRLSLDPAVLGAQTFAAGSTNYVHIRAQQATTSRDPSPEVLVSLNQAESGYAAILVVTTGGATVTAVSEPALQDGPRVVAPLEFGESVRIEQTTGGPAALEVVYKNSGVAPGVRIAPGAGATQAALRVESPSADSAILAVGTSTSDLVVLDQSGTGRALYATKSGPSGIVAEVEALGAAGTALQVTASAGADGVVIDSTAGGGAPLVITPSALGPSAPGEGAIWTLQGQTYAALRYRESSIDRIVFASQDGPYPQSTITTSTSTLAAGSGTTTIQSLSAYLRQGGTYRIRWAALHGRTAGTTAIPSYTCRVNAVAEAGANARAVWIPEGNAMVGTYFTGTWYYENPAYYWAGADGFVTIDIQITMSAGTSSCTFTNRLIAVDCLYS